jgi:hypothetical protein
LTKATLFSFASSLSATPKAAVTQQKSAIVSNVEQRQSPLGCKLNCHRARDSRILPMMKGALTPTPIFGSDTKETRIGKANEGYV